MQVGEGPREIKWRTGSNKELLIMYNDMTVQHVDIETERISDFGYEELTTMCWHPRNYDLALFGFWNGTVMLYNFTTNKEVMVFDKLYFKDGPNS